MTYIIHKTDATTRRKYLAEPGSRWAYCGDRSEARRFKTREEAEAERCVENERVEEL